MNDMNIGIIQLNKIPPDPCCVCGGKSTGGHSLPMFEGKIVRDTDAEEWGGFDCCLNCYNKYS
jgi:hypothetical protein